MAASLPQFAETPSAERLSQEGIVLYTISPLDDILEVGGDWDKFAIESNSPGLVRSQIIGRSLWDFVADETTRYIYEQVLQKVRGGRTMKFDFRCDSPNEKRYLRMTITAVASGDVTFETRTVRVESRPAIVEYFLKGVGSHILVIACSWCKKVKTLDDIWIELEQAIEELQLFTADPYLTFSHGICPECKTSVLKQIYVS